MNDIFMFRLLCVRHACMLFFSSSIYAEYETHADAQDDDDEDARLFGSV